MEGEGIFQKVEIGLCSDTVGFDDGGRQRVELGMVGEGGRGAGVGKASGVGWGNTSLGDFESTFLEFGMGLREELVGSAWSDVEAEVFTRIGNGKMEPIWNVVLEEFVNQATDGLTESTT